MIMFMPLYIPNDDEFSIGYFIVTIIILIFLAIILYAICDTESTLDKKYEDKEE